MDNVFNDPTPEGKGPTNSGGPSSKNVLTSIVGVVLLVGAVSVGVYLSGNQQLFKQEASESQNTGLECSDVIAYDTNWNLLSHNDLTKVKTGDKTRFSVHGINSVPATGTFEAAKFVINGVSSPEITDKRPGTEQFYYEYIVPADVNDFEIAAQIKHSERGWF